MALASEKLRAASPGRILVEGDDDRRFVSAILKSIRIDENTCEVISYGGKNNLRNTLEAFAISADFANVKRLAILRDADTNPTGAFQSSVDAIGASNLTPPSSTGIFAEGTPRVGVFILPSATRLGELEDLLLDSIEGCKRTDLAREYFSRVRNANLPTDKDAKAVVYSYLACQERAGVRIGEATEKGYFPLDSPAFRPLQDFLKEFAASA